MKASEIEAGTKLFQNGDLVYTVLWVEETQEDGSVYAGVRYSDGGTSVRVWNEHDEVPLTA